PPSMPPLSLPDALPISTIRACEFRSEHVSRTACIRCTTRAARAHAATSPLEAWAAAANAARSAAPAARCRASTALPSCTRRAARTTNAADSNAAGMVALPRSPPIRHLPRFHDRGSATAQPAAGNDPSWQRGLDLGADLLAADGHGELGPRRGQLRHRALRPVPITARDQPRRLDSGID